MTKKIIYPLILLLFIGIGLQSVTASLDPAVPSPSVVVKTPNVAVPTHYSPPSIVSPVSPESGPPVNRPVTGIVHSPVMSNFEKNQETAEHAASSEIGQGNASALNLQFAPDRVIVKFRTTGGSASTSVSQVQAEAHAALGATVIADAKTLGVEGMQVVHVPAGTGTMKAVNLYKMNPMVEYAQPDYMYSVNSTSFVPPVIINSEAVTYRDRIQTLSSHVQAPVISPSNTVTSTCPTCHQSGTDDTVTRFEDPLTKEERYAVAKAEVDEINAYISENNLSWTAAVNPIMLMSPEEREHLKGLRHDLHKGEELIGAAVTPMEGLPTSFNWRSNGGDYTTPIKNQGSCGSCWAFATTGAFESYKEIKAGNPNLNPDYAEQYLVNCASDQDGCNGGLFTAMAYFVSKAGSSGGVGTVTESNYPYTAYDGTCKSLSGYSRYTVDTATGETWGYVGGGNEWSIPSVDAIKTAIYLYGPVAAGVYAESTFDSYRSGILDSTTSASYANHAIIIVGWGELNGRTYWICKNSWGTSWGESGWFRIYAGRLRIGEGAAYFKHNGSNPTGGTVELLSTPSGAQIWIDGTNTGMVTPYTQTSVPAGTYSVTLKLTGYTDYTTSVTVTAGQTSTVTATLTQLPPGAISISSTPSGARIWLDGADTGKNTPNTLTSVSIGTHSLTLKLSGYLDYSTTNTVTSGQTATISATLSPSPTDLVIPNDPLFSNLWGLHNTGQSGGRVDADIDAPEAWIYTTGSSDVIVAVVDTGVDYTHPDLAANMIAGYDTRNDDNDPMDDHGHGTHCAGTIGAVGNNGIGVAGVAWNAKIMPLKFMGSGGSGYTSDAIEAFAWGYTHGARIFSNSWGGYGTDYALRDAINLYPDAVFICAAGNDGEDTDLYPQSPSALSNTNIIAVAATDRYDNLASFSNYGVNTVDVAAPGVSIYSTSLGNSYVYKSGTSMATPHVAGIAALISSRNPSYSATQLKQAILDGVDSKSSLSGLCKTGGRVNAQKIIASIPEKTTTITSITPASGINTGPVDVAIIGTNFVDGVNIVKLTRSGQTDITAINVNLISSTQIICRLPITGTSPGVWDVILTTGGKTATKVDGFKITYPPPKVTYITPASATVGNTITTTISGSNFKSPVKVWLGNSVNLTEIQGTVISQTGTTSIKAHFTIPWNTPGGLRDLTVQNPDGLNATLSNKFTVIGASNPVVTKITPVSGMIGNIVSFTLTGQGFITGLQVNLTKQGQTDVQAQNVKVTTATSATGQFVLPLLESAGQGAWNLVTSYPSGHESTLYGGFTITPLPAPKVTYVTPASSTVGNTVTATISGSNFKSPAQVWLGNSDNPTEIQGTVISQTGTTSIKAQFTIPWTTPGGLRNLTVQNPDGQTSTLANKFTIIGASNPVVTKITPATGMIGNTVSFTLTGRGFFTGLQVNLTKPGQTDVQAQNIKVTTATSASGKFILPLFDSAGQGAWDLVTSYPSGHESTLTGGFTITPLPAPKVTYVTPATGTVGKTITTTIYGSNFKSPVEVRIWSDTDPAGISGANTILTGSTSLKTQFIIPLDAIGGKKNLTVTNPDDQQATKIGAFTVNA